jgi:hypothetical protein
MPPSAPPPLPETLPRARVTEALLLRICRSAYAEAEPGFRAAGVYRFDDPDCSFGTCYLARDFKTCFFETIVRNKSLNIAKSEYNSRSVVSLLLDVNKLRLVQLHGDGAQRLRLDLADLVGADYGFTQALSKAIYNHRQQPDGLVYRSRYDDDALAIVLFERARPRVRLFPGAKPKALPEVPELGNGLRRAVSFKLV